MNTIEIRDEEIDVDEIMRKIREDIEKRGESSSEEMKDMVDEPPQTVETEESSGYNLQQELDYMNRSGDTHAEYSISSHRPILGRFLIKGRQLVHGEVRRYVDLIEGKQIEFNAHVARLINGLIPDIDDKSRQVRTELSGEIDDKVGLVKTEIGGEIDDKVRLVKTEIGGEIDDKVRLVKTEIGGEIDDKVRLVKTEIGGEIDDKVRLVKTEIGGEIEDKVGLVKTEIGGEIDDKVGLVKTEIGGEIEDKVRLVKTEIGGEIEDKVRLVKTEIGGEIEDKVGLVKTEIGGEIDDKVGLVKTEIGGEIDDKVRQVKTEIGKVIEGEVNEVVATINEDIMNKAWLADILEGTIKKRNSYLTKETDNEIRDIGINYFIFNETFGGDVNEIRCLEEQFLEFFTECKNVLDIGSGRGVFLELLREKGIKGYGIDTNDDLILYCQKKGLNVQKDDSLSHLKNLNSKSVDGVFMAHVIEHLRQEEIVHLIRLCHEKMQYGSHIVIVMPNILSVSVSANTFYLDPTHVTHVHPEVIKFLLRSCGYRDIQERFYPAIPDEYKLKKIVFGDTSNTEEQKKFLEIMNHNIDMLNNLLFGNRDYAVIAKK